MIKSSAETHSSKLFIAVLAALTLAAALLTAAVVNDDPYITYRYARNLATGAGFFYNPGEPVLSTTAPLYALILAVLAALKIDPPTAAIIIGAMSAFCGSMLLWRMGDHAESMLAAALLATSPLLWLAVGMESSLYLMLGLAAIYAADRQRWSLAGLLAGCATLTRGDGLLVVAIVALDEAFRHRRIPWRSVWPAMALIVPAVIVAAITYGDPLPATLRAKVLQANLGITGFFPGARFLDGLLKLAQAYIEHSALYIIVLPLLFIGAMRLRVQRGSWLLVAWGALQLAGYTLLGVAPYRWYYIPLLPAIDVLIAFGIVAIARRVHTPNARTIITAGLALLLLVAQARSIWEIQRSTDPNVPRAELIGFDALPETSGALYRRIGDWLREQTSPDATVGVMEVGVIGYYAERRMIDFLGLLRPEIAAALGRRDIYWSIPHTLPDFIVLTSTNPLYSYDLLADDWFRASYIAQAQFDDPRFWGSPMTIYARRDPRIDLETHAIEQDLGALKLSGYAIEPILVQPNRPMRMRLDWAKPDVSQARVSISLIGPHDQIVASDRRTLDTTTWPASGGSVYHTFVIGPDAPPGRYRAYVDVSSDAASGQISLGAWKSPLGDVDLPPALVTQSARFAGAIDLLGYRLEPKDAQAGDALQLTLYWQSRQPLDHDYTVFVHLENERGELSLAADSQPRQGDYPTSIWSSGERVDDLHVVQLPGDLAAGTYRVQIGFYLLESGQRLTLADGLDQLTLTTMEIRAR